MVASRTGTRSAPRVFRLRGCRARCAVDDQAQLEDAIRAGRPAFTDDPFLLCRSEQVDVVCEVTGDVEYGAPVAARGVRHGKDVVLMNAEIDATIGPILQVYAEQHGVDPVGLRRGRARRADEPLPLGQGPRARARA